MLQIFQAIEALIYVTEYDVDGFVIREGKDLQILWENGWINGQVNHQLSIPILEKCKNLTLL